MGKCEWCNKEDELQSYTDAIGKTYNICNNCYTKVVENYTCRKCGNMVDPMLIINGLCTNCVQLDMQNKSRKQEEVRMGVDRNMLGTIISDVEFTDDEYERWMTMGSTYSSTDMKNNKTLRRLWIMVKLNSAGIYNEKIISDNFKYIETILDRNLSKLVNNKCKIIIGETSEARKIIRSSEVIDFEESVYIIKA